jgi:basic membrane protein A and related proteins
MKENANTIQEQYLEARRKGKNRYSQRVNRGENGHLPDLEGALEHTFIGAEQNVGLEEVPLHKIVGTLTHSRARSFAPEFLPLPKMRTEFAQKWMEVYKHQSESGITDPVILREYLGWYWVVEGNKRVSVLKYLGAFKIDARVTRLLPRRDSDNPTVKTYYRFLEFRNSTGLSDLWIRDKDGYDRMLGYLEPFVEQVLSNAASGKVAVESREEAFQYFRSKIYLPFRELYQELGGDKLNLTTGEAFLRYADIAGFPTRSFGKRYRPRLKEVMKELDVEREEVGITTEPLSTSGMTVKGAISQLVKGGRPLKVSFVHYASPVIATWTEKHEEGRTFLQESLGKKVSTRVFWATGGGETFRTLIREAAKDADVVFSTAAILYSETRKVAMELPEVRFFVAGREKSGFHVRTYSPRTHEAHFLAGMVAGALCQECPIGFVVSNYSSYAFASVNAFTLGARGVQGDKQVRLFWSEHKENEYFSPGILPEDFLCGSELFFHNILPSPEVKNSGYGLYSWRDIAGSGKPVSYAELVYDWRDFYRDVVENIISGGVRDFSSSAAFSGEAKFLTYWGGIRNGILDLRLSREMVPPDVCRLVDAVKQLMQRGDFSPFTGPLTDRYGKLRLSEGDSLDYEQIVAMDYLVEGVEGPPVDPKKVVVP